MKDVRNERRIHPTGNKTAFSILGLLKLCAKQKDLGRGSKLHAFARQHKLLEHNSYITSTLVSMYARCGALAKAQQVINQLPVRNVTAWNALVAGYAQQGQGEEALKCFDSMQREGLIPDAITFTCALKACGRIGAVAKGEKIHDKVSCLGMLENDIVLGNTLVDMYARFGLLAKAQKLLGELPVRDVVTWNSIIGGYAQHGRGEEALECYGVMQNEGYLPDMVTFTCTLKACGSIGAAVKGKQIHDKIVSLGMLEKDVLLGCTLVDMYAKCGALANAQKVLYELPVRDVATWNALIAGYSEQMLCEEALKCIDNMQHEGLSPDGITFVCALKACGGIGAIAKGEKLHEKITNLNLLERDVALGTTLVNMYARCGALVKAQHMLNELPVQNVISWTMILAGYAEQGQSGEALNCFESMQFNGVGPDSATLVCVLNACSHSGLVDKAEMYFSRMSSNYDIAPNTEHYCCMVDMFGRAGRLNKVLVLLEEVLCVEHLPVWLVLLGASLKWRDVKVGKFAFERVLELDKGNAAAYVCMANIYMVAGMKEEAGRIEVMRIANEAW